jgi:hypothetical protein
MRKTWLFSQEKILIDNYSDCTIKELCELLPMKSKNEINCKVARLKKQNKITSNRKKEVIDRAYSQRK